LLSDLLALPVSSLISIVGAGGKTTTMYTLASELAQRGKQVITTTTTNIYFPQEGETDTLIIASETSALLRMVSTSWYQHPRITIAGGIIDTEKLAALRPDQPYALLTRSGADVVIVEADGARHRLIKAPAAHEPVIPSQTHVVLIVMSAEAINQPLTDEIAHRPEQIIEVTGIKHGERLTPSSIARLVTSEQGGLKGAPATAKAYLLITHTTSERLGAVKEIAHLVRSSPRLTGVLSSERIGEWAEVAW
jgi:probable selenium-dependent hydroxylase accessory protein YqeC